MTDRTETTGWQPLKTAPRGGRRFILWDGWQQCLASYENGRYLVTYGRTQNSRRLSELSMWHALPKNPA